MDSTSSSVDFPRHLPRLMLAAPMSGGGKTTVTCGLLSLLISRGMSPVSFKCGPDYIDPMFHSTVIGTPGFNLDLFFSSEEQARSLLARNSEGADIAVLEGVMGFYDGLGGTNAQASAYHLSSATDTPVILVVDAHGASLSVAAMVKGFMEFRPHSNIKGVLLNRVGPSMREILSNVIEQECGIPVVGCLPNDSAYSLESRHLGLVTASEVEGLREKIALIADALEKNCDIDLMLKIANSAPDLSDKPFETPRATNRSPRIAIADDNAFCFYYHENIQMLEDLGAEIVRFSPIRDAALPDGTDALYLGGGYPELNAKALEANVGMRKQVLAACEDGMPVFAECGGFLYLQDELCDLDGNLWQMVGFMHGSAKYTGRLTRFGYVNLLCNEGNYLCDKGGKLVAHEFHYYDCTENGETFDASKPIGNRKWKCFVNKNRTLAGFPHLYFPANGNFARRFVLAAEKYGESRRNSTDEGECADGR
ncbi:MAG: cobyrinate a,c-diamide synthase [Coriobacteriales bacterium]|jgi:cobyrinic acid a,c-diamide synthase